MKAEVITEKITFIKCECGNKFEYHKHMLHKCSKCSNVYTLEDGFKYKGKYCSSCGSTVEKLSISGSCYNCLKISLDDIKNDIGMTKRDIHKLENIYEKYSSDYIKYETEQLKEIRNK